MGSKFQAPIPAALPSRPPPPPYRPRSWSAAHPAHSAFRLSLPAIAEVPALSSSTSSIHSLPGSHRFLGPEFHSELGSRV